MNKLILVVAVFIVLYMCGCASTKEICIIDSQGNPLNNCYIFVQQENILYPNSNELFITNQTGTIKISYNGLIHVYAGKEGYFISSFTLVGKKCVRVVVFSRNEKIPTQCITKSIFSVNKMEKTNNTELAKKWLQYARMVPIVNVDPLLNVEHWQKNQKSVENDTNPQNCTLNKAFQLRYSFV